MPRLRGVRQYRPLDVYDSFYVQRELMAAPSIRLFGHENIGNAQFCNVQVPKMLASDQTAIIGRLEARTNIATPALFLHPTHYRQALDAYRDGVIRDGNLRPTPLEEAMVEFAMMTLVTLMVGEMPQMQTDLASLLRQWGSERPDERPMGPTEAVLLDLATQIRSEFIGDQTDLSWDNLVVEDQQRWLRAARVAWHRTNSARPIAVVPVRQNCSVVVDTNRKTLAKLTELMPQTIAPAPLVWIHLKGWSVYDD